MTGRRWTICKSAEGEWMSFDINATSSRTAALSYHRTHDEAIRATDLKIRREAAQ